MAVVACCSWRMSGRLAVCSAFRAACCDDTTRETQDTSRMSGPSSQCEDRRGVSSSREAPRWCRCRGVASADGWTRCIHSAAASTRRKERPRATRACACPRRRHNLGTTNQTGKRLKTRQARSNLGRSCLRICPPLPTRRQLHDSDLTLHYGSIP